MAVKIQALMLIISDYIIKPCADAVLSRAPRKYAAAHKAQIGMQEVPRAASTNARPCTLF